MTPKKLTGEEARERIEGVLKAAGIRVSMWSGDDIIIDAEFPDGAQADCVETPAIVADGLSYQRG
jgi:hypothetical protein